MQPKKKEIAKIHAIRDDGMAYISRDDGKEVRYGFVKKIEEGKPLVNCEIVKLSPREEENTYNIESECIIGSGPSQIATEEYRQGWDNIWGKSTKDMN
jgi:hypothetical protein